MKYDPAKRASRPICRAALLVPVLLGLLAACGQKGPLVLPGHGKDTAWPVRPDSPPADVNPPKDTGQSSAPAEGAAVPPRDPQK